ncbi:hypothetical protein [Thiolapillus sp.]|uniref:hypothetical protein n=1 Tax=Thiolapillus sp. TaxID=2017437 RepID=UPI003AF92CA1
MLLVASQSCDIANNNVDTDPYIELSVARKIEESKGHLTYNKNPRILHTYVTCRTSDGDVFSEEILELKAFERIVIQKEVLAELQPDPDRVLEDRQLKSYVAWLAARYSRPALPTTFNNLIRDADPKGKLRNKVKKGNEQLVGIYVEIIPDAEIKDDESYNVNLLGLLPAGFVGDSSKAENAINAYADVLRSAGMEVTVATHTEDKISLAMIKRFKRFYYDDLSLKEETPLPPETQNIL